MFVEITQLRLPIHRRTPGELAKAIMPRALLEVFRGIRAGRMKIEVPNGSDVVLCFSIATAC